MKDNLQQKTVHALFWSFLEAAGQRGVQFIIGIVLARLLFPEQFGLIGMLTIFIAVSQSLLDSGFGSALIQKRELTQTDISSVFYFNIVVGLLAAGLLCLIAPWVAVFYKQPLLASLMRALSLTMVINAFGLVQNALLRKHLNFKITTKVSLIAGIFSGLIGISLAASGFGVWSLVVQQISNSLLRVGSLWFFSNWRPVMAFRMQSLREMFGFGSRILVSGLLNQIFDNIYLLVIGRFFSPADLGFFSRAKTLNDMPSATLTGMVARVTFPVFSTIQDDAYRLKRGLKKALANLALFNFPMMIGMAIIARPLVVVLLTEKWAPSAPYLQLLCVASLLFPLHAMNLNVLQALGRSDLFLKLEIIKKGMIAVNIAITWQWGISPMIIGMIILSMISLYLNSYYNGVLIGYRILDQLSDIFPYLLAALLMGIAVYAAGLFTLAHHWSLLVQIATGVLVYACLCRAFRLKAFMNIWEAGWTRIRKSRWGLALKSNW